MDDSNGAVCVPHTSMCYVLAHVACMMRVAGAVSLADVARREEGRALIRRAGHVIPGGCCVPQVKHWSCQRSSTAAAACKRAGWIGYSLALLLCVHLHDVCHRARPWCWE